MIDPRSINHDIDPGILRRAYGVAARESDDPHTQVGAVIIDAHHAVIVEAANTIPRSLAVEPALLATERKYEVIEHAERNAIFRAAYFGHRLRGAILYAPWFACCDCARAIIESGVVLVVGHWDCLQRTPERWRENIDHANEMLDKANVGRLYHHGPVGGVVIRFAGQEWEP